MCEMTSSRRLASPRIDRARMSFVSSRYLWRNRNHNRALLLPRASAYPAPLPAPLSLGWHLHSLVTSFSLLLWLIYWFPFRLSSSLPLLCIGICRVYLTSHSPETRHHNWVTTWRQSRALSLSLFHKLCLSLSLFTLLLSLFLPLSLTCPFFPPHRILSKCAHFLVFWSLFSYT